jgi:GAF domain-containing protein
MLQRLQAATTLQALYEISVTEIQAMTGYDRVLIYRFEEEGHGQVIAEASDPSMEVFNGLFFPASDIPSRRASCTAPTGCGSSRTPIISQCRWCPSCARTPDAAGPEFRHPAQRVADSLPVHEKHGRAVVDEHLAAQG